VQLNVPKFTENFCERSADEGCPAPVVAIILAFKVLGIPFSNIVPELALMTACAFNLNPNAISRS
jgi:hypothetical protein